MYRNTSHSLIKRAFPSNRWWNGRVEHTSVLESDQETTVTTYKIHLLGDNLGQEAWWLHRFIDNLKSAGIFCEQWKIERITTHKYVFIVTTRLALPFEEKNSTDWTDDPEDLSWLNI